MVDVHKGFGQVFEESYRNHQVFELIDHMMEYYEDLSDSSFWFMPKGTLTISNYSSRIYMSIHNTLGSIKMLLKEGHISDAFVLIRKLFDTVLVEIYLNVLREDRFDWEKSLVVKDVDEWLKAGHRIPSTKKILKILKNSYSTKDLYQWFGWDTYLKKNRELLDDHVHSNSYRNIILNCPELYIENREKQLGNAAVVLEQIMLIHTSFTFYMNGHYMMATDYMHYIDENLEPPEGSQYWLAAYAQRAFDEFIKPHEKLAAFIKEHCVMDIE